MTPFEWAMIAMMVIGSGAQAHQQKQAGKAQEQSLKFQAKEEEAAARDRELVRKQKINKVLAAQIAGLGASGISAQGTPQLIAQENIRQESFEGLTDVANRSGRTNMLLNQASSARKLGNLQAATTLVGGLTQAGLTKNKMQG
jgi:hypothetical protein